MNQSGTKDSSSFTDREKAISHDDEVDFKSKYLDEHSQDKSEASNSFNHVVKSFSILKEELVLSHFPSVAFKFFYFFTIFVGFYANAIEYSSIDVFVSYATNSYKEHSLMSTISIVRGVIAAAALPAYARLSDTFGRVELFLVAMIFKTIGCIIMSQATNVQRYAGGMVFYSLGYSGARIVWQFNLQDATTLRYRLMGIAVVHLPSIIDTWTSGEVVNSLLVNRSWSFGVAMWAFIFPLACVPYFGCVFYMKWRVSKTDEYKELCLKEKNRVQAIHDNFGGDKNENGIIRSLRVNAWRFSNRAKDTFWRIDLIGCLFIVVVFGCILVPLTLAGGQSKKWAKASTIVPLVVGFLAIPLFIIWESKIAKRPLIPFELLKDRGIYSAFSLGVLHTFALFMPNSYAYPVLLVGMNASVTVATRTRLLTSFVMGVFLPILSLIVAYFKRTKAFILMSCCFWFVSMGLFIHFRGDNDGVTGKYYRDGVAVGMCLLGIAMAGVGRLTYVSAQACTNHEYMATVTSLFASLAQIGMSLGRCVSGAMWTQKMYGTIASKMKELGVDPSLAKPAYASPYNFIKTYKWGSPERVAVVLAYADLQRQLSIVALCLCVPILVFSFTLRDHRLQSVQSLENDAPDDSSNKDKIVFSNDDDPIFRGLRKLVGRPRKVEDL